MYNYLDITEPSATIYSLGTNINLGHGGSTLANLRDDPNFPGFYVLSGQGMTPAGASAVRQVMLPAIITPDSTFRQDPLDFENFVVAFEEKLYYNWWDDPIKNIYISMNFANNNLNNPFSDLFDANQFLGIAANNTLLHYNFILDDQVDASRVAKICEITSAKTSDTVFEFVEGNYMRGRVSVPCFTTKASLERNYNHGNNFCFSGDHAYINTAKNLFMGMAIAVDLAVGLTGVGLFVEAPVP